MVGISPILSFMDNNSLYISLFCLSWAIWLVYHQVLSVVYNIGWHIFQFCVSMTILVGISPTFVCHGK